VFVLTSFREKALSAASQACWSTTSTTGSPGVPSRCSSPGGGLSVGRIGILVALYPAVWGVGKLATGALPDRWGRKWLIAAGMWAAEEVCSARFGAGQLFTRARENGLQPSGRNSDWVAGAPGRCG
jgi:MFS family permease